MVSVSGRIHAVCTGTDSALCPLKVAPRRSLGRRLVTHVAFSRVRVLPEADLDRSATQRDASSRPRCVIGGGGGVRVGPGTRLAA